MKKALFFVILFFALSAYCHAQDDSTRSVVCPLKVLQLVKKQYCTISVYTENNGLLTNLYALIFYPATKELFQVTDGRTGVAYDHTMDAELQEYCW